MSDELGTRAVTYRPVAGQVDLMAATRRAGATLRVQRRHTHVAHQTLDALAIDRMPPSLQLISDPAAAVERKLEVDLVDQTHQDQVFVPSGFQLRLISRHTFLRTLLRREVRPNRLWASRLD